MLTALLLSVSWSCTDKVLDEIDTNPNSPTDVSITLLVAQVTTNYPFAVMGTDLAWYSSVFVEHTTGVHGQLENADKRTGINSTIGNNAWNNLYAGLLRDLDEIIIKGSEGGSEAGYWNAVGIARVLRVAGFSVATDLWGKVPYSQALQGNRQRKPAFDNQADIYPALIAELDVAIADLARESTANVRNNDLIAGGNAATWTKAAHGLKARLLNRLSKRDPQGSATAALAAAELSFGPGEGLIFDRFTTNATGENPWFQESNDRSHHAISNTFFDLLTNRNDPRANIFFGTVGTTGEVRPAPNGRADSDQAGILYSRASRDYVTATSPMSLITYDEIKFIEAEARLRLGQAQQARAAYLDAVAGALVREDVAEADREAYLAQPTVAPEAITLENIITEKYISLWLFQPIEAFNDYRRTGFPALTNVLGAPPRRFPYPQSEIDSNEENVPSVTLEQGVWWDTGVE